MGWILKAIFVFICEVAIGGLDWLGPLMSNIFGTMYQINIDLGLNKVVTYTQTLGLSLVALYGVKQGIDVYCLHMDGDPDADPLEIVTRISVAVATIMCGVEITEFLIKKSNTLCAEAVKHVGYDGRAADGMLKKAFTTLLSISTTNAAIQVIFLAIVLISLCIFIYKAAVRGAELMGFQILLPLVAIDMLTTAREKWNAFKNELGICIFGYVLQVVSFNIFLILLSRSITLGGLISSPENIFALLGWLKLVLSAPKWMQKFIYSTGSQGAVRTGATLGVQLIPQLIRK